jgi:hypothetical protein
MKITRLTVLALLIASPVAYGMRIDFIKVNCDPEKKSFRFEHYWEEEEPPEAQHGKKRITAKEKQSGYYDPEDIRYTCQLSHGRYTLVAQQAPMSERGECGGAPEIRFSLLHNRKPVISDAVLGYSCWGSPTIEQVVITKNPSRKSNGVITTCSLAGENIPMKCQHKEL